jgi:hypothetical protein
MGPGVESARRNVSPTGPTRPAYPIVGDFAAMLLVSILHPRTAGLL